LIVEKAGSALNTCDLVEEPKTFEEAYFHPDANRKMIYQEAIMKEYKEMSTKLVVIM
jgi:hypothetical protein